MICHKTDKMINVIKVGPKITWKLRPYSPGWAGFAWATTKTKTQISIWTDPSSPHSLTVWFLFLAKKKFI